MSGPNLSDAAYATLNLYSLLAATGITTTGSIVNVNAPYAYYSPTGITATVNGTSNSTNYTAAEGQRLTLQTDILTVAPTTPNIPTTNTGTLNYSPGIYTSGSSIGFTGATINLNGDQNSKFYFRALAGDITFTTTTINLVGGVQPENVYWVASAQITFASPALTAIQGIFIAGTLISFADAPVTFTGRLYAGTQVTFVAGTYNINGSPPIPTPLPISNICFVAGTPIITDQGEIAIEKLNKNIHTIGKNSIVGITNTVTDDSHLICFEKDSLALNYPNKRTVMTRNHKVKFNGQLIEAYKFLEFFENVHEVEYNGCTLYNVLLHEHSTMKVNGMECETLHPAHKIAKYYRSLFINNGVTNNRKNLAHSTLRLLNRTHPVTA